MPFLKTILLLTVVGLLNLSTVAPDSAGIVEMVNGLAYGGIPYGSITGMVAKYPGFIMGQQFNSLQARQLNGFKNVQPVVITPNFRATRLAGVHPRPVQIYNVPSVVAPGVVGTISHIGY
ncbi:uncharacterized protein LOC100577381 [Apis mellifera]|uniref:Uncharacterized protein LOC100577381 n=1 Tax=Apis mellifera TaxID=7460 RepID=A0A7M7GBJ0_APIME|nr:uncharacterized protein LOC100577381 [Apis mellifera]|eukprot:XP_003250048.2 uncharacterized protein LOC100577381 [Apis mellifera]